MSTSLAALQAQAAIDGTPGGTGTSTAGAGFGGAATSGMNDNRSFITGANFNPWVGTGKPGVYTNPAKINIAGSLAAGTNTLLSK